jgi:hypothetical protein
MMTASRSPLSTSAVTGGHRRGPRRRPRPPVPRAALHQLPGRFLTEFQATVNRFNVVAYDGLDRLTGKERRGWHPVGRDRDEAAAMAAHFASERVAAPPPQKAVPVTLGNSSRTRGSGRSAARSEPPPPTGTPGSSSATSTLRSATSQCAGSAPNHLDAFYESLAASGGRAVAMDWHPNTSGPRITRRWRQTAISRAHGGRSVALFGAPSLTAEHRLCGRPARRPTVPDRRFWGAEGSLANFVVARCTARAASA